MARGIFDTLKFVERLKTAGIPEAQAKAFAEAQREVFAAALDSSLASHCIERKLIEHDGEFKLIKFMIGMLIGGVVALVLESFF